MLPGVSDVPAACLPTSLRTPLCSGTEAPMPTLGARASEATVEVSAGECHAEGERGGGGVPTRAGPGAGHPVPGCADHAANRVRGHPGGRRLGGRYLPAATACRRRTPE